MAGLVGLPSARAMSRGRRRSKVDAATRCSGVRQSMKESRTFKEKKES